MLQKGLSKLYTLQKNDGGWGWWPNSASDPYMSAYVVYSLKLATDDSIKIKRKVVDKGILFISNALGNKKNLNQLPGHILLCTFGISAVTKEYKIAEQTV